MINLDISHATSTDVALVAQIEHQLNGAHAWTAQQLQSALSTELTESSHPSRVMHIMIVAKYQQSVKGYAVLQSVFDEAELHLIGVNPDYQRQGIASRLLRHAMQLLVARGVGRVFLEVRASNMAAIQLYEKQGFEVIGRRKGYYPHLDAVNGSREDAVLMSTSLQP